MSSAVVLVVPPFLTPGGPALGAEILAAGCRGRGISCSVVYANLQFAARIGDTMYRRAMLSACGRPLGEAAFAPEVWTGLPDPAGVFFPDGHAAASSAADGSDEGGPVTEEDGGAAGAACYRACRAQAAGFVEDVAEAILAHSPRIVGFSALAQQTLASLALAAAVKSRAADVLTVLGGDAARPPRGQALADVAPMLDCLVAGEADEVFPRLCRDFVERGERPPRLVACEPVVDLDKTAVPDFSSYLRQLHDLQGAGRLPDRYPRYLLFESARECWWAERSRCRFCAMTHGPYRRKSRTRIVGDLRALAAGAGGIALGSTDCAMPPGLPEEVLPELLAEGFRHRMRWPVRPDLTRAELELMERAGVVEIEPGIESLCPSVLSAFRKGVRAHQDLVLLRECRSQRIAATWHFLLRVPGDDLAEYEALVRLLPALRHLQPPSAFGSVHLQRSSPFYEDPARFGIEDVRPAAMYRYLFPPETRVEDIALEFEARWPSALDDAADVRAALETGLDDWMRSWRTPEERAVLHKLPLPGGRVFVQDTRPCATETFFLGLADSAEALDFFDTPRRPGEAGAVDPAALADVLERRFVVEWDGRLVSLVTRDGSAPQPAA